jgi:hypothetical protein
VEQLGNRGTLAEVKHRKVGPQGNRISYPSEQLVAMAGPF